MTVVSSNYARKENDLYETEAWATEALLSHFPVAGGFAWEPAAGNHKIADTLRRHDAKTVLTSDIVEYDRQHTFLWDFLNGIEHGTPGADEVTHLITNPPYGPGNRQAVRFAELALQRCDGLVALLLTAKFDFGKTRRHLFGGNPRFTAKISLVDRIQWFPGDTTGTEDHAWYVWTAHRPTVAPILLYAARST